MSITAVGSQGELRLQNEERILAYIRENPGCTQGEISTGVGLTRAGVSKLLGTEPPKGKEPTSGLRAVLDVEGSRPARFALAAELGGVMTIDIGSKHIRLRVADLLGKEVAAARYSGVIDVVREPMRTLDVAAELMESTLAESPFTHEQLAGIVIGVPFPVRRGGVVLSAGEWRYAQLPTSLWERLDWSPRPEAAVNSDADLGAMAEVEAAIHESGLDLVREDAHVLYVKWSSSVTSSIIIGGELHTGYGGLAGQWPHNVPIGPSLIEPQPPLCTRCGRSCLNSRGSVNALSAILISEGHGADLDDKDAEERAKTLVARARGGDERCIELLNGAAQEMGRTLGQVINLLNPRLVVIGGAFRAADYGYLAEALHKGVEETAFAPELGDTLIQAGRCTGSAAVRGGLVVALRKFAVPYLMQL